MVHTRLHTVKLLHIKTPDRHTVVAAQPKKVIEYMTCICSTAICATQKQRGDCYCSLRTWHDSLSTCEPSGAIRLSTRMYRLGSSADHRAGPELPCSIMFQLPWNTKQACYGVLTPAICWQSARCCMQHQRTDNF